MTMKAISAPSVLTDEGYQTDHAILIKDGKIEAIIPTADVPDSVEQQQCPHGVLVPGFIDLQVNGGGGILFNDAPTVDTVEAMIKAHCQYGTTAMLPTLITDNLDLFTAAIAAVNKSIELNIPGIIGIHLEGPFLNREKKGIHDGEKIQALKQEHLALLSSVKGGKTLMTIAPEKTPSALIQALVEAGIFVSAGHTNATYEQMQEGLSAGVSSFTHLYNAMSALESRKPGVVGAALTSDHTYVGLIPDGHHVHPAALLTAVKAKGPDHCMIVTDSMCTVGSKQTYFDLNGERITLAGGKLTNDAGVLAGSALDMASAVRFMVQQVGLDLETAIQMASKTPAEYLGLSNKIGTLKSGLDANILLIDDTITVQQTIIEGQTVFNQTDG